MSHAKKPYVIVVAIDYSESGTLAFHRALELAAEKPSARVHVINVLPVYQSGMNVDGVGGAWAGSLPSVEAATARLTAYVTQEATAFRNAHPGEELAFLATIVAHQRLEIPSEEIAQLAADLDADLVVLGTHGRRGMSRLLLGSVAEATVRLAPCPVLVVRPKAIPAPAPAIEPPCPRCVEARAASGGKEFWCEQHRERHGQRHTYHQGDRVGADTNMPLVARS